MDEQRLADLQAEDEQKQLELSIAEKRAMIAKAKQMYGNDWRRVLAKGGGVKSGMDWDAMKFKLG